MTDTKEEFFVIPRSYVLDNLSSKLIEFYQEADYLDLTKGDIHIASSPLKNSDGGILDNISYDEGRAKIKDLGLKLPSAAIIYQVMVPWAKGRYADELECRRMYESMIGFSEFLEDRVVEQPRHSRELFLTIGSSRRRLELPGEKEYYSIDGYFSQGALGLFGFPDELSKNGEFTYHGPRDFNMPIGRELYPYGGGPRGEVVAIKQYSDKLGLNLLFRGHEVQDNLGIRGIKIE